MHLKVSLISKMIVANSSANEKLLLLNKGIVFLCVSQVSAWGGYVFIINLIPLHVFVLLLMQRYSKRVYIGELQHDSIHTST